ncbi:MAG TPA: hypothetical protein VFA10_19425 [Ktedonobacteraceae bacterium]|nr:hypothetical protein [Ktedonobacteraceae bacterium]
MSEVVDELSLLLDEVARRLSLWRRTFTEKEALQSVWEAGYEIPIQSDARFVLVHEGDGKHPSHWRLAGHTVANSRLLHELLSGTWDGRDLDEKLATLDAEDQRHYVFYPLDARLTLTRQGILEPAEHERNVKLPRKMKTALDALAPRLLAAWHEAGAEPWTLRTITEVLRQLEWSDAGMPNAWLYVRAWLLTWSQVRRVGLDYWSPLDQLPQAVQRTRLQVLPVRVPASQPREEKAESAPIAPSTSEKTAVASQTDESQIALKGEVAVDRASWTVRLRTVNLLEGFLHIPTLVRNVYPLSAPGEEHTTVLRGMWHEDGTRFWLWLNRRKNQLYGPELADRLMWLEAGTILRIEWAPDIIVIRQMGLDEAVRDEEARLVDISALAALRGGLGEHYRRSLQAILAAAPNGMSFAELVIALRERQQHEVHCGTIHATLYGGGFVQKDRRWFAAPDAKASARQLRAALVETLLPAEEENPVQSRSHAEYISTRVKAIHRRLAEIVTLLRETS